MSACIGLEIDQRLIRGVRLEGWSPRPSGTVETDWTPEHLDEVLPTLRERLGQARRVAVAIGLPLLFAKRVKLPPLPATERRKILRLEPQRFFPVRLEDLVVGLGEGDLVFAAREDAVAGWTAALRALGPVDFVEPSPVALARALRSTGVTNCTAVLDEGERGVGLIEVRGGSVTSTRRVYGTLGTAGLGIGSAAVSLDHPVYLLPWSEEGVAELGAQLPGVTVRPLPEAPRVPAAFLSAYGAALGIGHDLDNALLPDDLAERIRARRRRELALAALTCAASIGFALASVDAWRARAVARVTGEVERLETRAAPALALRNEIGRTISQAQAIARMEAERPDPLRVMLTLSSRLPSGAHLRALRLTGAGWQIDGYAAQAAGVIQALGGAPEFHDVHFLSATNRAQIGGRTYESFSVAFRFGSPP